MATEGFQVVWAKVRGYAWWPGIIKNSQQDSQTFHSSVLTSDNSVVTLYFIGENTHADLNSKFIKDFSKNFEKYSKTHDKVSETQHLLNCIKAAQQLLETDISMDSLAKINNEIKQKKHRKYNKSSKEIEMKLFELQKLVSSTKPYDSKRVACHDAYKKHEKFLAEIVEQKSIETTGVALCETLIEILKLNVSNIIDDPHIKDLLSTIADLCLHSNFMLIREIGKVIGVLGNEKECHVADKCLRSKACTKIARVLEENQFEKADARNLALSIEEKIRRMDPSMGVKYHRCFSRMIKEIKIIKYSDYSELISKAA